MSLIDIKIHNYSGDKIKMRATDDETDHVFIVDLKGVHILKLEKFETIYSGTPYF